MGILFSATHAFLSILMFFLVDCIYRRYHTRSLTSLSGILHLTPNLGISIIIMVIFFSGLPGTLKFISEFYLFAGLIEISATTCFLIMFIANVIGLIGFSKCWFNAIFGINFNLNHQGFLDLTVKELFIVFYCFFFLFFFSFLTGVLF